LPPVKLHCSMLAEDAIKAAVYDFKVKRDKLLKARAEEHAASIQPEQGTKVAVA
jgi:NifU-like N terminal domain